MRNEFALNMGAGRPKNIPTPEDMQKHFIAYRDYVRANPLKRVVKGNKGFVVSDEELRRPLTLEGFEVYCIENNIISDISDYFENKENRYKEFIPICALIKKTIRQDQIEGGMTGIYNASITQRLNGLVDKQETKVDATTVIIPLVKLPDGTTLEL